jgi:hypothetical protein
LYIDKVKHDHCSLPGHHGVKSSQNRQRLGVGLFVSRQSGKSRRKHDLEKEQSVADVAGQQICDPAATFLVLGALVETDIITLFAGIGSVHQELRRGYANEPLEQLERTMCYSILCAVRGIAWRAVGHYRACWAGCGRGSSTLAGVDVIARHRVGAWRQRAGLELISGCACDL